MHVLFYREDGETHVVGMFSTLELYRIALAKLLSDRSLRGTYWSEHLEADKFYPVPGSEEAGEDDE
jgi:hypothetical protein